MNTTLMKERRNEGAGVGYLAAQRVALTMDEGLWQAVRCKARELGVPLATYIRMELKRSLGCGGGCAGVSDTEGIRKGGKG